MKQASDLDFLSASRILNLPNAVSDQEPATLAQLNSAVEGLAWKDSCRVGSISNINISSPGASIDGITLSAGERVLVKDQTAQSENGIYVWNGAAVAMTRALDASTSAELEQAIVSVEEGTNAGATFRQSTVNFVLGSDNVVFVSFAADTPAASETVAGKAEIATQAETDTGTDDARFVTPAKLANHSGRKKKATLTFGDGAATSYSMTHNFGTRDVQVQVYRNSSPWDTIQCDVERTDANTVTLKFSTAPTSNQFIAVAIA